MTDLDLEKGIGAAAGGVAASNYLVLRAVVDALVECGAVDKTRFAEHLSNARAQINDDLANYFITDLLGEHQDAPPGSEPT